SSRRRHTRSKRDWSSDVCSSDLKFLEEACKKQASDIHFYPSHDEDHVDIFYRLLGKRVYIRSIKKKLYAIILAYLKYSAHMDISEKRKPQSGKMHYTTENKELYALRLSTLQ